jgi:hypothetical protein
VSRSINDASQHLLDMPLDAPPETLIGRAKQIQALTGCNAVTALRQAKGERVNERSTPRHSVEPRRRLVDTGNGAVISVFIDGKQIVGAVRHPDGSYQITTTLPGRPFGLLPLDVRDREQVDAWLEFIGDLAEGKL